MDAMSNRPTEREMLLACLDWLDNIKRRDLNVYLDAMPNNILGAAAMRERLIGEHRAEGGAIRRREIPR